MSLFTLDDVVSLRSDRLVAAASNLLPGITLSDDFLLQQLQASEADISHRLKVFLEPTVIFPYEATDDEIAALQGAPYFEEPGYDYDINFFQGDRWGYIVTRNAPIVSIEYVRMSYPNPQVTFYTIPTDWLRIDKKYGQIRMVPASSAFTAPLGAFIMQAFSGGATIPSMIQVKYTAGLQNVKTDPRWADLLDVIYKNAVLRIIEGSFIPQSGSISADGLSQSMGIDTLKFADMIDAKLFGPKGVNGGLWTTIHGVSSTIAGVIV